MSWAVDGKSKHESARDGDVRSLSKLAMRFAVHFLPCSKYRASRVHCAATFLPQHSGPRDSHHKPALAVEVLPETLFL